MALSSLCVSCPLSNKLNVPHPNLFSCQNSITCPRETASIEESNCKRRLLLLGAGILTARLLPTNPLLAQGIPKNYQAFVDPRDGYSYIYPSDWIDCDFVGHDSAFKDRILQFQFVRVRFIPTDKKDIHDLGPVNEVVYNLVKHVYATPNQIADIEDMQERTIDGKNYYAFEYKLTSPNYSSHSFATIAIANGRYYTLVVGALDRRWKKLRNKLKLVADSFRVLDI
ncbi:photosynthetic NDH subunit of lumenal location 1, chloroplastic [Mangifera indica]|uniref:photosynthetic NDH subunit of lumenal location 1, chloroplastic n=1 Tax=Mangifera indica TaxID=29780 RepID=UPI001CFA814C|nr:photosynthetic NDH subunit of lumenal location 1, chloroplastic [Mangifera indica]